MPDNSFVMMALGRFRFSLATAAFQELERPSAWRWPGVERIGSRPALQYVGPGEDRITMRGTIYPHFRGGLGQVAEMRAEASLGEPLQMVDGTGRVWGQYVITDVREGQTVFFSNGKPRKVEFDLSLSMYGEEGGTGSARSLRASRSYGSPLEVEQRPTGNAGSFDSQTAYNSRVI